jgi:hypothetical protein
VTFRSRSVICVDERDILRPARVVDPNPSTLVCTHKRFQFRFRGNRCEGGNLVARISNLMGNSRIEAAGEGGRGDGAASHARVESVRVDEVDRIVMDVAIQV